MPQPRLQNNGPGRFFGLSFFFYILFFYKIIIKITYKSHGLGQAKPKPRLWHHQSDRRIYDNILPCRQNKSAFVIHSRKTDLYLSCICVVFENKVCLTICYLVVEMYSESSNFINPVFESRSGNRIVLAKRICSDHVRLHISGGQNIC